jgi:ribose 5-phosphate isomerase B
MVLAIASDHAGFSLKRELLQWLDSDGSVRVLDLGPSGSDSVDYPEYASVLCRKMQTGEASRGILICNSGIGMSISANRYDGVRAALCLFPRMCYYARHHNDANVLVLGAGITSFFTAKEIVQVFLTEDFDGGRHERRICKIDTLPSESGS